jgi:hypothetical protein
MAQLATDALIGLSTLVVKAAGFGGFDVLTPRLLLIGACMIPGTSFARSLILRTPLDVHVMAMEVIVVLGACSLLWHASAGYPRCGASRCRPAGCLAARRCLVWQPMGTGDQGALAYVQPTVDPDDRPVQGASGCANLTC